ncbi:CaiB/BaiF CoA transferase family protein [Pseudofrankia inefficax]|uniref:L-carnitine dehydratase/bile acid-inducible protein F n=1 Tax=Pseudofrankia inefficax (strain DSM 45817 / CECT 9037 / DDB 130130 / EuI1c) TaxID=298654 RepID=E3J2J2_PSEI1|nr:CoA transferase [Pseudofrankia inefficax]ADP80506.1 L-carnitine dehydratase/bile acid-inducible protein F [Pseudofrankia inefficax]
MAPDRAAPAQPAAPLAGVRVLELSTQLAGPYCGKLFADAGADVVKVEPPGAGDPLRAWSASGAPLDGDGALFRYLNASKRSVAAEPDSPRVRGLAAAADVVITGGALAGGNHAGHGLDAAAVRRLHADNPRAVVVSISPFGLAGPWTGAGAAHGSQPPRDRAVNEFLLQALCGSTAARGEPDAAPLQAGGRIGEWAAGVYAAVVGLAALRGARRDGVGDLVDLSILECMTIMMGGLSVVGPTIMGGPGPGVSGSPGRVPEIPSIVPTKDGLVGFCTITAQQFQDFLVLIERPDLLGDRDLALLARRHARRDEFLAAVHSWSTRHTTDEIVELAAGLRIPVTPVGTPSTVTTIDHFTARGVFVPNPSGGFAQPRTPYRVDGFRGRPLVGAPALGEHTDTVAWEPGPAPVQAGAAARELPLDGLRVLDLTAFWAGPSATMLLGSLGADVIKVEGVTRPDGLRFAGGKPPTEPSWWEWGTMFLATNANKRAVSLELSTREGQDLAQRLIGACDVVIENFTPRVLPNLGLDRDAVRAANPATVLTRMPAFGLDGPWRDRTGFAQTMEQASGLAWLTGTRDGPPVIPRGACDPIAGLHAAFATLVALTARDRPGGGGVGAFVEATMVESVLNVAAELTVEHSAYGASLHRDGNRGPLAAPQGTYHCSRDPAGPDVWLALAVTDDAQWPRLCAVAGRPDLAADPGLATLAGRRATPAHDRVDAALAAWAAALPDRATGLAALAEAGVPAAPVTPAAALLANPQLVARGFFERLAHPVVGEHPMPGVAFRLASHPGPLLRRPAPVFGQHDDEVYRDLLGLTHPEIEGLRARGVLADRPAGV